MSALLSAIQSFALEEYLQGHGFAPLKGDEWLGHCPSCGKRKLAVHASKRTWHCWVCQDAVSVDRRSGAGSGGLLDLLMWLDCIERRDAAQHILDAAGHPAELRLDFGLAIPPTVLSYAQKPFVLPPEGAAPIHSVLPYMATRRITMLDVQRLGLFQVTAGRYARRLVFPCWEERRLVYWQARAMFEAHECSGRFVKCLNPPAVSGVVSSEVVFNLEAAAQHPRVCLVEGPMDALRVGADGAACFGKKVHPKQVQKLLARGVRAVDLMFDGPSAREPDGARREMVGLGGWLASFFDDVRLVFLPSGDPADHTREELARLRAAGVRPEAPRARL